MLDNLDKFIKKVRGRIFVDIATDGCGSGCTYCYITEPHRNQTLVNKLELKSIIKHIDKLISKNDILSFCPNTEPLKSVDSRSYILNIIENFKERDVVFQISTKEFISKEFLENLNLLNTKNPIEILISIPLLEGIDKHEPNAGKLVERLENFKSIGGFKNLRSCLYIKPFNNLNIQYKDQYVDIINNFCPDDICIGLSFSKDLISPCSTLHDFTKAKELLEVTDMNVIFAFAEYLRQRTCKKIFYSSVCVLTNNTKSSCILDLKNNDLRFCKDCSQGEVCNE
jgi:hypothetical protein